MQGRRREDQTSPFDMLPGDYAKHHVTNAEETESWEMWFVRAPDGHRFFLANEHDPDRKGRFHEVEEHEDGTISVLPRPNNSNSILSPGGWHGYLRRGKWVTEP